MVLSNKEIETLQGQLTEEQGIHSTALRELKREWASLENLKFQGRNEETPAVYETKPDPDDATKTIQVLKTRAVTNTIFDIPAKSIDDPSTDLDEIVRQKVFNQIKAKRLGL